MVLTRSNATMVGIESVAVPGSNPAAATGFNLSMSAARTATVPSLVASKTPTLVAALDRGVDRSASAAAYGSGTDRTSDSWSTMTTNDAPGGSGNNLCKLCGVSCKSPAALEKHLSDHTEEKPFQCQVCDKCFKTMRNLHYHLYAQHGDQRYATDVPSSSTPKITHSPDVPSSASGPHLGIRQAEVRLDNSDEEQDQNGNSPTLCKSSDYYSISENMTNSKDKLSKSLDAAADQADAKSSQLKDMDSRNNNKPASKNNQTPSGLSPTIPTVSPTLPTMAAPGFSMPSSLFSQFYPQSIVPAASYKMWNDHYLAAVYALKNGMTMPGFDFAAAQNKQFFNANAQSALSPTDKSLDKSPLNTTSSTTQDSKSSGSRSGTDTGGRHAGMKKLVSPGAPHHTKFLSNVIGGAGATDLDPTQLLECPHCGKLCRKPCDLKRHLMMHTGEKPFKCKVCGQKFRAKGSMMYHQKAAHGIDVKLTPGLEERYLRARANQQHRKLMQITQLGHMISPIDQSRVSTSAEIKEEIETDIVNDECKKEDTDIISTTSSDLNIASKTNNEPENLSMDYKHNRAPIEIEPLKKESTEIERGISTESDTDSAFVNSTGSTITSCTEGANKADASSFDSGYHNESSERSLSVDEGLIMDYVPKPNLSATAIDMAREEVADRLRQVVENSTANKDVDNSNDVKVANERVLVTQLEGQNISSGADVSLYKCYLCGQIFTLLSKLQAHLVAHAEVNMPNNLSQCPYCSAVFKTKTQLGKHVRSGHKTIYSVLSESEKMEYPEDDDSSVESQVDEGLGSSTTHLESDTMMDYRREISQESALEKSEADYLMKEDPQDDEHMTDVEEENRKVMRMKIDDENGAESFKHLEDVSSPGPKEALLTSTPMIETESTAPLVRGKDGMYSCRYCARSFYRLFSLQRHERVHTGFKPCFCRLCGKGFSEPRNLRQHLSRFHPDEDSSSAIATCSPTTPTGRTTSVSPETVASPISPSYLSTSGIASTGGTKRARRTYGRSAQRLLKVTPDMIEDADKEALNLSCKSSDSVISATSSEQLHIAEEGEKAKIKTELEKKDITTKCVMKHDLEKAARQFMDVSGIHESFRPQLLKQEEVDSESIEHIRAKESLGEDVTVVIPSDSPLDPPEEEEMSPEVDEVLEAGEVQRPAWKHLMMNRQRNRRQSGVSGSESDPVTATTIGMTRHHSLEQDQLQKPPTTLRQVSVDSANISKASALSPGVSPLMNPMAYPMVAFPGSYYNQQALLASGLMPFITSGMTMPNAMQNLRLNVENIKNKSTESLTSPKESKDTPTPKTPINITPKPAMSPNSPGTSAAKTASTSAELMNRRTGSGWLGETNQPDALNYTRSSSSLSRKHSRLPMSNNSVGMKREDALTPMTLEDGRTVYRCSYCSKDFTSYSDINRHMDFHEDIRPYKCKFCEYYARTNSQLKVHMMRHQGIREFHCKLCNYKGVTQSDLNRHMKSQIHMMKAHNQCSMCGEGFVSPKNLQRHQTVCPRVSDRMNAARDLVAMSNAAAAATKM